MASEKIEREVTDSIDVLVSLPKDQICVVKGELDKIYDQKVSVSESYRSIRKTVDPDFSHFPVEKAFHTVGFYLSQTRRGAPVLMKEEHEEGHKIEKFPEYQKKIIEHTYALVQARLG